MDAAFGTGPPAVATHPQPLDTLANVHSLGDALEHGTELSALRVSTDAEMCFCTLQRLNNEKILIVLITKEC